MKTFLRKTSCWGVGLAALMMWSGTANAQSTRAIAAVETRSPQSGSEFHTVGWRNGYYGRGYAYGYYGRPYASYYGPGARYYPRYYAPYYRGYGYGGYGYPNGYYGPRRGYGYPYGAARVGPVRVFWR